MRIDLGARRHEETYVYCCHDVDEGWWCEYDHEGAVVTPVSRDRTIIFACQRREVLASGRREEEVVNGKKGRLLQKDKEQASAITHGELPMDPRI